MDDERRRLAAMIPNLPDYARLARDFQRASRVILPTFENLTAMSQQVKDINKSALDALGPVIEQATKARATWSTHLATALEQARLGTLPPNLRSLGDEVDYDQIVRFVEEEGITLYLVPRAAIAKKLLDAKDRAARRDVLGRNIKPIIQDSEVVIGNCQAKVTKVAVDFINEGIASMKSEHYASAQALFTNVLDTLMQTHLTKAERKAMTTHTKSKKHPAVIDDLELRQAYVMLPIWRSYESYWASNGDPIPTIYSRHASAHGVSTRQYSKRNTVQALMLVTSYAGLLNGL